MYTSTKKSGLPLFKSVILNIRKPPIGAGGSAMATQSQLRRPLEVGLEILDGGRMPNPLKPGTVFILDSTKYADEQKNPYLAAFSCPRCGATGFLTSRELYCGDEMICGGDDCSAEYHIHGETLIFRPPQ
jgi:hypothetical protein